MLEDVFRLRRDMRLFMARSLKLAAALKEGSQRTEGSSSIGFDALSHDLFQIGKVFNNYLARLDKTIEDIPGAVDTTEDASPVAKLEEAKERIDTRERPKAIPPQAIRDMVHLNETYEQTNERLLPIYREAHNMKERLIAEGDLYKDDRTHWEMKARKCDLVMFWMHGRLIETV